MIGDGLHPRPIGALTSVVRATCLFFFREGESTRDSNSASVPDFGSLDAINSPAESTLNPTQFLIFDPNVKIATLAPAVTMADSQYDRRGRCS